MRAAVARVCGRWPPLSRAGEREGLPHYTGAVWGLHEVQPLAGRGRAAQAGWHGAAGSTQRAPRPRRRARLDTWDAPRPPSAHSAAPFCSESQPYVPWLLCKWEEELCRGQDGVRGARGDAPQRAQRVARHSDFLSPLLGPWFAGIAPNALAPLPASLSLLWHCTLLHLQPSDASFLAPRAAYKSGLLGAFAAWRGAGGSFGMPHHAAWAGLYPCALPRRGLLPWVVGCGGLALCQRCGWQRGPPLLRLPLLSCPLAGGHRLH